MPAPDPRLARVRAPSLSDAMRKLHPHRAHVLDLVSPTPDRVLFGPAATMLFAPVRADVDKTAFDFPGRLAEALGEDSEGKVVVAHVAGAPDGAVAGGVRLAMLERARVAGLVTDGRLRDWDEARGYAFACWCRGETAFAGSAEIMPVATGIPVSLGGATVMPGDYVYVDAAGGVVIPARDIDAALELAAKIEADDVERVRKARGG